MERRPKDPGGCIGEKLILGELGGVRSCVAKKCTAEVAMSTAHEIRPNQRQRLALHVLIDLHFSPKSYEQARETIQHGAAGESSAFASTSEQR